MIAPTAVERTLRLGSVLCFGLLATLVNPAFACSSDEETADWQYDEADMKAAVEGEYVLRATGASETATVEITQRPASSARRLQCGTFERSFLKKAGACATERITEMAIEAKLESSIPDIPSGTYTGRFTVEGKKLAFGQLLVSIMEDATLEAEYEEGALSDWRFLRGGKPSFTLVRIESAEADSE